MKRFLIILITFSMISKLYSQITQEFIFQEDGYKTSFGTICLDKSGLKYAIYTSDSVKLYNTDHSLFRKFKILSPNVSMPGETPAMYFSENLFDTDNEIEYIIQTGDISSQAVNIINEQGLVEESFPNSSLYTKQNNTFPELDESFEIHPIFNVGDNAKMILRKSGHYTLYNLPGKLKCDCNTVSSSFNNTLKSKSQLNAYPNPANEYFKIIYELPNGINQASLELFDSKGCMIKSYIIDKTFSDLNINTADLKSGVYIYRLKSGNTLIGSNKIIIDRR